MSTLIIIYIKKEKLMLKLDSLKYPFIYSSLEIFKEIKWKRQE
jgi:hypothetical protein